MHTGFAVKLRAADFANARSRCVIASMTDALRNPVIGRTCQAMIHLYECALIGPLYELYAHIRVGELVGLTDAKIAMIAAGQKPADLIDKRR